MKAGTVEPRDEVTDDRRHVAVMDLGSNSVRLVVYDQLIRTPFPRFNEKFLCRLGASLDEEGNLGEEAMDCTVRALERFAIIASAMQVSRIDLLATESTCNASNGAVFRERLEAASGLEVRVLSGDEPRKVAGVPGRRVATVPAAALVLDRVLRHLKPGRVLFSGLGVREGWLYGLLPEQERAKDPLSAGCRRLAAETVRAPGFAGTLERWTEVLFVGESVFQHRLRIAAASLSDIVWREHSGVKAQHSCRAIASQAVCPRFLIRRGCESTPTA